MDVDEKKAEPKPTFQEFMTKIVNAYKTGNNGALNNYAKLQTFAKKVGCLKLHINGDKSYNNIMWLSINNKLPNILGTCADNYTRYYIEQFLKNNKSEGKVSKWVQNNIKLDNNAAKDLFKQGISAYFKRINTCITLKPFQYIDEDINEFSKLILEIFKSISNIIKNKKYGFPTQLDFAILVKASRKDGYKKSDDSDSDSDSDSDIEGKKPTKITSNVVQDSSRMVNNTSYKNKVNMDENEGLPKIIIKNLNFNMSKDDLIEFINAKLNIQSIVDVFLPTHRDTRLKNRGFGFISFDSKETADKAVKELNNMEIFDRIVTADYATIARSPVNSSENEFKGGTFDGPGTLNFQRPTGTQTQTQNIMGNGQQYCVNMNGLPGIITESDVKEMLNMDKLGYNIYDIKTMVYDSNGIKCTNVMIGVNTESKITPNKSSQDIPPQTQSSSKAQFSFSANLDKPTKSPVNMNNNNTGNKGGNYSKYLNDIDHDKLAREIDELLNTSSESDDESDIKKSSNEGNTDNASSNNDDINVKLADSRDKNDTNDTNDDDGNVDDELFNELFPDNNDKKMGKF